MARSLPPVSSLEAILFDVDGTLADSDPLHFAAFRDMLVEEGYQEGKPITEEFFSRQISGKFNVDIGEILFPEWDVSRRDKFMEDKEALFRRMAASNLEAKGGLHRLCDWIKKNGLKRAAVTNAPRENAELMIESVGLKDFFDVVVIGMECERAKPFPDPYLEGLKLLGVPAERAFAIEDSPSGMKAAVSAQLAVVGVVSGNPGPTLLEAGASFLVSDFNDPALWAALQKGK